MSMLEDEVFSHTGKDKVDKDFRKDQKEDTEVDRLGVGNTAIHTKPDTRELLFLPRNRGFADSSQASSRDR